MDRRCFFRLFVLGLFVLATSLAAHVGAVARPLGKASLISIGGCALSTPDTLANARATAPSAAHVQAQRPVLTTPTEERYTLHPGDVLDIQYRYTPEFNQTVTVQPDGYISLAVGGDLKVGGRTLQQLRGLILAKARTRLESPELTVVLKEFQKPYIVVAGEVNQPGKIELREKLTAIQAVLLAGGMKETAKSSQILIFRKLNGDTAEVKVLNLKTLKRTSDLENDLALEAGDMIMVPRNRISKIERYIRYASVAAFFTPLLP